MRVHLCTLAATAVLTVGFVSAAVPCGVIRSRSDRWVDANVDLLVRAARSAFDHDYSHPRYQKLVLGIATTLQRCRLSADAGFAGRFQQFIDYVETASMDARPGHELGFVVPDKQYFEETRELVEIPDFLLDPRFLRLVSRAETLYRAKSYLRDLNTARDPPDQLVFFSYRSRHLGTPDNPSSYLRLLIVVPGDASSGMPEKWVQFGITDPRVRVRTRNVSVVSVVPGTDGTFSSYFKDFFRTFHRNGSISIKGRWELGYGDDNCTQCHKSGVLPIFPEAGSVGVGELPSVEKVNEKFRGYGSPRFGKYLDASNFGPGLSFATTASRELRYGKHFGDSDISRAMSCSKCHSPDGLGYLNWPMDKTIISSFIRGGEMPRGHSLSAEQRSNLYRKLIAEYFATDPGRPGILKSWLLGRPQE